MLFHVLSSSTVYLYLYFAAVHGTKSEFCCKNAAFEHPA
jgi:hypothetical protein